MENKISTNVLAKLWNIKPKEIKKYVSSGLPHTIDIRGTGAHTLFDEQEASRWIISKMSEELNFFREQKIEDILLPLVSLCKVMGIPQNTLLTMQKTPALAGILAKEDEKRKLYKLGKVVARYIAHLKSKTLKRGKSSIAAQIELEKLKIARLTVEKDSLNVARLKKETTTTREVKEFLTKIFATLSTNLLTIPSKISRDVLSCSSVTDADDLIEKSIRSEINRIAQEAGVANEPQ